MISEKEGMFEDEEKTKEQTDAPEAEGADTEMETPQADEDTEKGETA